MSDEVFDASALVLVLSGRTGSAQTVRARLRGGRRHAPHLVDAEVGNVLRRHERAGQISAEEAATALRVGPSLIDHRYAHHGALGELAWTLRASLSFYDALYVALAASLDAPLVTCDARLSRAPGLPCEVELV